MENLKHTKGEWEVDGHSIFPKGKGYSIALVSNISIVNSKHKPLEETEANAKLIASAPELLEALIEYVNLDTGNISALKTTPQQRKEKAINAINKATK
jgi:methionine synthase II (cobalamin-independent)